MGKRELRILPKLKEILNVTKFGENIVQFVNRFQSCFDKSKFRGCCDREKNFCEDKMFLKISKTFSVSLKQKLQNLFRVCANREILFFETIFSTNNVCARPLPQERFYSNASLFGDTLRVKHKRIHSNQNIFIFVFELRG